MKHLTKDIVLKWIEALRSGKYPQGHGALRSSDGYCCLGVLCDVLPSEVGSWSINPNLDIDIDSDFEFLTPINDDDPMVTTSTWSGFYLKGAIGDEFNQLFNQPAVRKIFFDQLNATPWKDVDLKNVAAVEREPDSQQLVLGILNDLGVNHNEINPENRVAVPFTVLADWLEAAVNVADFSL
jgi:hypothetical protein